MPESYKCISVSYHEGVLCLTLELSQIREYETSVALQRELMHAAENEDAKDVIVDFRQLEYMSSVGYLPFVSLRASFDKRGGRVVFCNQSPIIKGMFESTRMLIRAKSSKAPFQYAETLEEALALLQSDETKSPDAPSGEQDHASQ